MIRSRRIGNGVLYWGIDEVGATVVNGQIVKYPRVLRGLSLTQLGFYILRRRRKGQAVCRLRVVNYTHPFFAAGVTTSGGLGLWFAATKLAKRGGGKDGDTHRLYSGYFAQAGAWWAKLYLYVYPNGDGFK